MRYTTIRAGSRWAQLPEERVIEVRGVYLVIGNAYPDEALTQIREALRTQLEDVGEGEPSPEPSPEAAAEPSPDSSPEPSPAPGGGEPSPPAAAEPSLAPARKPSRTRRGRL